MIRPQTLLVASVLFTLIGSTAWAQPAASADDLVYRFEDDALLGDHLSSEGDVIRLRTRPARTLLLRPRTQFISELNKSVENL
jgi:hypothetical protein